MPTETRLRDGTRAIIWRLLPSDRDLIREGYEHLSPEAQYHRFLSAVPHLTESMLRHLVDEVDGVNHVAVGLFAFPDGHTGVPAGIARMVRYPDQPHQADAAVTVLDEWQGRGVATELLDELIRRRPQGITQIVTDVAADNQAPIHMLRHIGTVTLSRETQGLLHVVCDLPEPAEDPWATVAQPQPDDTTVSETPAPAPAPHDDSPQGS